MRTAAALLLLAATFLACAHASPQGESNTTPLHWSPASYHGLILGSSKLEDVVRVLGNPSGWIQHGGIKSIDYRGRGEHGGDRIVLLKYSGVIIEIQESFPVAIPRSRIYKELGREAMTAHFSKDKCGDLYRDPAGGIELTFYPARGIYLWPDQYGYDFAAIHYAAKPPWTDRASPDCK